MAVPPPFRRAVGGPHRVVEDDQFRVQTVASTATDIRARVLVQFDDGSLKLFEQNHTSNSDRTTALNDFGRIGTIPGRVVRATVAAVTSVKRGQCYVELVTINKGRNMDILAQDYIHASNQIVLDRYQGPLEGKGNLDWIQIGNEVAGTTDTDANLAATNARRVIHAALLKYQADATVATRTLQFRLRDVADTSGPTGFTLAIEAWDTAAVNLTASEEGQVYATEDFVAYNDNGTQTFDDNASAPNPFPILVEEGDTVDLRAQIGNGQAGDVYDYWIQVEEWIEV